MRRSIADRTGSSAPIYYDARRYEDAIVAIESLRNFETILTDFYLAASHAQLGHEMQARQTLHRGAAIRSSGQDLRLGDCRENSV
jgi:hypothetical protein